VTWIAGGPPEASVPPLDRTVEVPYDGPPWLVQVGLSEADAEALRVRPGTHIPLVDDQAEHNVEVKYRDGGEIASRPSQVAVSASTLVHDLVGKANDPIRSRA